MKKVLFLIMLISSLLVSCTSSELRPPTNSEETIVDVNTTKENTPNSPEPNSEITSVPPVEEGEIVAGKERWTVEIDFSTYCDAFCAKYLPSLIDANSFQHLFFTKGFSYDDTSFYLPSRGERIVAVDSSSGLEKWQSDVEGYVAAVGDDTVFVLTGENRVYGLDKYTGDVKWKIILDVLFKEDTIVNAGSLMHKVNDKFVLIIQSSSFSPDQNQFWLLPVDEKTGDYVLIQADPELAGYTTPFVYFDNLIVVKKEDTYMGVNYEDGSIVWRITPPEGNSSGPGEQDFVDMDIEGKILYLLTHVYSKEMKSYIYDLLAIDMMTGDLIWGGSIGEVNNSLGVGIYTTSCDRLEKYLVCKIDPLDNDKQVIYNFYDRKTGQLVNTFTPERWHYVYLSENGLIVEYSEVGIFQGIDYLTGEILWENDEEEWNIFHREYSIYKDVILVMDPNGDDLAVDQRTGNHLWVKDGRSFLGTLEDKWLFNMFLVDPYAGEEQRISFTEKFDTFHGLIEVFGKTLIFSDLSRLTLVDLAE